MQTSRTCFFVTSPTPGTWPPATSPRPHALVHVEGGLVVTDGVVWVPEGERHQPEIASERSEIGVAPR